MKRATYGAGKVSVGVRDFNPRPREEGDGSANDDGERTRYFNPRPREEGDAVAHTGTVSDVDFNPRPREEGDKTACSKSQKVKISIHALVKRATNFSVDNAL